MLSVVTSARDYSKRADENLTNLYTKWKAWLRPNFQAGHASLLFAHPEVLASNKACRELQLSKLYQKNVVVWLLTRLTVMWIGKFIIFPM